ACAAAGRLAPALIAETLALGGIESALLALPLLPLVAPAEARRRWIVAAGSLGLVWLIARFLVRAHGVVVPDGMHAIRPSGVLHVLFAAFRAQSGLEDLGPGPTLAVAAGLLGALRVAVAAASRPARERFGRGRVPLSWALGGLLFWIAGTLPLAG